MLVKGAELTDRPLIPGQCRAGMFYYGSIERIGSPKPKEDISNGVRKVHCSLDQIVIIADCYFRVLFVPGFPNIA
jgi:hypothetical protein